jgi:hypothetical protein
VVIFDVAISVAPAFGKRVADGVGMVVLPPALAILVGWGDSADARPTTGARTS